MTNSTSFHFNWFFCFPSSNYVVQHLLALEIPQAADDLHRQFLGSYVNLSCNKYGSNVVEKCLTEMGYNQFKQIIVELLEEFLKVLLDEFGNYVIRRAVEVSKVSFHMHSTGHKVFCIFLIHDQHSWTIGQQ